MIVVTMVLHCPKPWRHLISWCLPASLLRFHLLGIILGRDCRRPLFWKQFPSPLNCLKSGVSRKSRHGFKVGEKWVSTHFWPIFAPKNPLLDPFQPIDKKNILNPLQVEINYSPNKGPEAALTQHKSLGREESLVEKHGKSWMGQGERESTHKQYGLPCCPL